MAKARLQHLSLAWCGRDGGFDSPRDVGVRPLAPRHGPGSPKPREVVRVSARRSRASALSPLRRGGAPLAASVRLLSTYEITLANRNQKNDKTLEGSHCKKWWFTLIVTDFVGPFPFLPFLPFLSLLAMSPKTMYGLSKYL